MKYFKFKYEFAKFLSYIVKSNRFFNNRILMYHSIFDNYSNNFINDLYTVNFDLFKEQISLLNLNQIYKLDKMNLGNNTKNKFFISFDDGYIDNYKLVYPYLEDKKIFWTIFITTDFLKENNKNYININHLIELSKSEFVSIGSHGKSHKSLLNLNTADIKKELDYSKKFLEDIIGNKVNAFSYPNGSCNKTIASYVKQSGYDLAFNSYPYFNNKNANPYLLNRQEIISYDDMKSFNLKITGKFDWTRIKMHNPHL